MFQVGSWLQAQAQALYMKPETWNLKPERLEEVAGAAGSNKTEDEGNDIRQNLKNNNPDGILRFDTNVGLLVRG
jgi:hypothetical protein